MCIRNFLNNEVLKTPVIEIICHNQLKSVLLNPKDEPTIICLEPYENEFHLELKLPFKTFQKAVSMDLRAEASYITCYSELILPSLSLLFKQEEEFILLLCLSHHHNIVSLKSLKNGLSLHAKRVSQEDSRKTCPVLLVLKSKNLNQIIHDAIHLAIKMTGNQVKLMKDKRPISPWCQSLGWDSKSIGDQISHVKIIKTVSHLINSGVPLNFVLIEEGWQQLEDFSLKSFEANQEAFPQGLKKLVLDLNDLGIAHVGVCHSIIGSSNGLHKDFAKKYELIEDPQGKYFVGLNLGKTFEFYNDYYHDLSLQGITFIKVGDPLRPFLVFGSDRDVLPIYKNLQSAILGASSIHFNSDCILNENFNYMTILDDVEKHDNLLESIRNHLMNSLWTQYLTLPEFDTWNTACELKEMLAIFHALSGSINVITDTLNEPDIDLIKKMVLPSGKTLQAERPLTLCQESIFFDPLIEEKIYKAFTLKHDTGVLAVFNLNEEKITLQGIISASDIDNLKGDKFALHSYYRGFLGVVDLEQKLEITLQENQADVFTFAPIKNGIGVLGCYNFFLLRGPIIEVNVEEDAMHIIADIASPILIYCEREIFEVRRNDHAIPWEYDEKLKTLSIDSKANEHSVYSISFE